MNFVNKYTIRPMDVQNGTAAAIKVVAVAGLDDWAAYYGLSYWSDERVAEEGDKIGKAAAELLFPAFKNSGRYYRD